MALAAAFAKKKVEFAPTPVAEKTKISEPLLEGLNKEQLAAFECITDGYNVFLTGPGGTGKSYFLDKLCSELWKVRRGIRIGITALTGCAALLLGHHAKTLHSWAGIGLGKGPVAKIIADIRNSRRSVSNWTRTNLLVIDEISMMTVELFEKLDAIGRALRKCDRPFGGLQLLLVGDFFQLPPVIKSTVDDSIAAGKSNGPSGGPKFVFESSIWPATIQRTIQLHKIYRQSDPQFQEILMAAREGRLTTEHFAVLESRRGIDWQKLSVKPTLIFSRKAEVERINVANMAAIKEARTKYTAITALAPEAAAHIQLDSPDVQRMIEYYDRDAPYSVDLELAIGAQVMLITNLDQEAGLVNGSRGVVVGFGDAPADDKTEKLLTKMGSQIGAKYPVVEFTTGERRAIAPTSWGVDGQGPNETDYIYRIQVPLRLAWATTIHKAQGASLDCALVDVGRSTFEYGQAYVALSRVRSLDALYIWDLDPAAFKVHEKVRTFYQGLNAAE